MNSKTILRDAVVALRDGGIEAAAGDARILLAHAWGVEPSRLGLQLGDELTAEVADRFSAYVTARLTRQPVAQIIGQRLFWGRVFKVTSDTLDPRPETEILVEQALSQPFDMMLDMGLGTGCILLSCLASNPDAKGVGLDLSEQALAVARENADRLGVAARATLLQSDWFSALGDEYHGRFDLIVSNPPYIASDEMGGLSHEVHDWEPHLALSPGGDGLEPYRIISARAVDYLRPQGRILFEIGPTQGPAVAQMLSAAGFENVQILPDFDQRDRVVLAYKPQE